MSLGIGGDVVARIKAVVEVDTHGLTNGLRDAEKQAHSSGSKIGTGLKVAGTLAAAGIGLAVGAIGESVKAAIDYQKVQAQLKVSLKNAGLSWKQYGGKLDDTIKKQAELSGFTEDDLTASYSRLITVTHNVAAAHKSVSLAMDVSRATGKPLTATTLLLMKAYNGSNTALSRLGIVIPKVTTAQDKLKASGKTYTASQMAAAKAADLRSQREENLAAIQKKFGGSSAAYAKTAAGEWDRFHATLGIVETEVGQKLLPVLTKVLTWLLDVAQSKGAREVVEAIGTAFSDAWKAAQPAIAGLKQLWAQLGQWYQSHSAQIGQAISNIEHVFRRVFDAVRVVIQTVMPLVKKIVVDNVRTIRDIVQTILDLLSGHWGKVWGDMKRLVGDVLGQMYDEVRGAAGILLPLAARAGAAVLHGIASGLRALPGALLTIVKDAIKALPGIAGWIGSEAGKIGTAILHGIEDALSSLGSDLATIVKNAIPHGTIHLPGGISIPYATGGIAGAGLPGRDSVPAMLTPGEMILNAAQQSRLAGLLGVPGGSGPPTRSSVNITQHFHRDGGDGGSALRQARFAAEAVFGG